MNKPKELYWVEMRLSGKHRNRKHTAGVRGGKRSSLRAAKESRAQILAADPEAVVKIYLSETTWTEVI